MKRVMFAAMAVSMTLGLGMQQEVEAAAGGERDYGAAMMLSAMFPGAGEWYNSGFKGGFPLVECIAGHICPCVRLSSMIDAADGREGDRMRINFWSAP